MESLLVLLLPRAGTFLSPRSPFPQSEELFRNVSTTVIVLSLLAVLRHVEAGSATTSAPALVRSMVVGEQKKQERQPD